VADVNNEANEDKGSRMRELVYGTQESPTGNKINDKIKGNLV